ncbi:hypothetical protein QR680_015136 [Steinernema hermaphroditum]|uniref:Uncharacterized protein n=1 Tax=Steinernema hermaphroditum TaxID=289476 RepID=A0AA39M5G4_9BILA|nr:hypothetical protein QR680_015136 [Steinernema hermaphroditum]
MSDEEVAYSDDSDATVYTEMRPGTQYSVHFETHKAYDDLPYNSATSFTYYPKDSILRELKVRQSCCGSNQNLKQDLQEDDFETTIKKLKEPDIQMDHETRKKMPKLVFSRQWRVSGYHPGRVMEPRPVEKMSPIWKGPEFENIMAQLRLEESMFKIIHGRISAEERLKRRRSYVVHNRDYRGYAKKLLQTFSVPNIHMDLEMYERWIDEATFGTAV